MQQVPKLGISMNFYPPVAHDQGPGPTSLPQLPAGCRRHAHTSVRSSLSSMSRLR